MKNLLKLASQTIDGLRALPAIARVLESNRDGLVSVSGALKIINNLVAALERDHADQAEFAEAKARIATLVESDGRLRLENERLKSALNRDKTGLGLGLERVMKIANGYSWIRDGEWASYHCDDRTEETLRRECGELIESVATIANQALVESGKLATAAIRGETDPQVT